MLAIGQHVAKHLAEIQAIRQSVELILADWQPPAPRSGIVPLADHADDAMAKLEDAVAQGLLPPDFLKDRPLIRAILEMILKALLGDLVPSV